MPWHQVKGDDGKAYWESPDGRVRHEITPSNSEAMQPNEGIGGFVKRSGKALLKEATNPDVLSGLAGALAPETGGASLAIPAAVGAGTSLVKDYMGGETDPLTAAGNAAWHGGVGALSGAASGAYRMAKGAGSAISDAASAAASAGGKLGLMGKLAAVLRGGEADPQTWVQAGTKGVGRIFDATIDGETLYSPRGLGILTRKLDGLQQQMFAAPEHMKAPIAMQIRALTPLRDQVHQVVSNPALDHQMIRFFMDRAGIQTGEQQGAALAKRKAATIAQSLRAMLAGGSAAQDLSQPQ